MKIKNLAIIILMTTFFIILGTKVYATTGTIKDKTVKLRKEPDSKTVLDYVYKGDEVEIIESEDGWYKVKAQTELGKVTGYISEDEIEVEKTTDSIQEQPEQPQEVEEEPSETIEATTPNVTVQNTQTLQTTNIQENNQYTIQQEISVKALPLINSREKAKITGNVTVTEIINDWARVENDVENGWVRKNILKSSVTVTATETTSPEQEQPVEQPEEVTTETQPEETTKPEEPQEQETAEIDKVGYVSTDGLRVRKRPSTDSEEIDSLSKNDEVQIIGQEGKWYKIDLDGKTGYVSSKYISDTKVAETTSRSGSTLRNENVVQTEQVTDVKQEETPKVEEAPTTATTTSTGTAIVEYAKQYLGYKYVSGGASPSTGFDCSGFTTYVYKHFGVSLNRTSSAQINNGVAVSKDNLQPGDLVLFNNDANTKIGHVGIYIGDGNFIHASNPKDGVKITTLLSGYYKIRYVGARRVI